MYDLIVVRGIVLVAISGMAAVLKPFDLPWTMAAAVGAAVGAFLIFIESRIRHASLPRLIGASIGVTISLLGALMVSMILGGSGESSNSIRFAQFCVMILAGYVGLVVGAKKGEVLNLSALGGLVGGERQSTNVFNLLDTSVIIDGRIADIAEAGFLAGTLAIPQFVLRELQLVADSADSLKRNRGRRGLDILQRLQKKIRVEILEEDFPHIRDVDMKLVEMGKLYGCKVVTNDFNLNKVAQLNGVSVLNINELANALKPVVLPGEIMRVFVLKEGKEYNQGVAYLDDGTMVVIDNARRMISKTIDVAVTSVLQTTAGKMIFGRFDERTHAVYDKPGADTGTLRPRDTTQTAGGATTASAGATTPQHT